MVISNIQGYGNPSATTPQIDNTQSKNIDSQGMPANSGQLETNTGQAAFEVTITQEAKDKFAQASQQQDQTQPPAATGQTGQDSSQAQPAAVKAQIVNIIA